MEKSNILLLTGSANSQLANKVAHILHLSAENPITHFADGEIKISIKQEVRGRSIFIIQPTCPPVNDTLMELLLLIDAVKRASAKEITAVIPYFGYSRQDRKDKPRVPISSALVAKMITASGAQRIVTVDIHSDQQQGFFPGPWDNLYGSYSLIPVIKSQKIPDLVVASPDKGGVPRAVAFAQKLAAESIATVYKERDTNLTNQSQALDMIGNVEDKNVLLVDDIIDTGGTTINAAALLKKHGAKKIFVCATHGLFSGPVIEKINCPDISQWFLTDSIKLSAELKRQSKITVVSIAPLLAEAVKRIFTGKSLGKKLFI